MEIESIIQWNCNGLRARQPDLQKLIQEENPSAICLQETRTTKNYGLGNLYSLYLHTPPTVNQTTGGVAIAIKTAIPHTRIILQTTLQAIAIETHTPKIKTICCIYIPPNDILTTKEITDLIKQLKKPFILVGDFNAHNPLWYDKSLDNRGKLIEDIINLFNLTCINEENPTYFRSYDQAATNIDLTLISRERSLDFVWNILEEQLGSDHYPIVIRRKIKNPIQKTEKWNHHKARWKDFTTKATIERQLEEFGTTEEAYNHMTETILQAAQMTIPMTKTNLLKRPSVPWWNEECTRERRIARNSYKRMKKNPNPTTITTARRREAIKRRTYRRAKKTSWIEFISSLNAKTPCGKVWEKMKKIKGTYTPKPSPVLIKGNNRVSDPIEVSNMFVEQYSKVSNIRGQKLKPLPSNLKRCKEDDYNDPISIRELKDAIKHLDKIT